MYCGDYLCHDDDSFDKTAVRIAVNGFPTINPYEWISVKDRLPEVDDMYLCVVKDDDGEAFIDMRSFHSNYKNKFLFLNREHFEENSQYEVTHWMTLPELPKGEIEYA